MEYKFQYKDDSERVSILNQNSHLLLLEEQNITEGNYLIFGDEPRKEVIMVTVPEEEFNALKQRQDATDAAVLQLLMEGMM